MILLAKSQHLYPILLETTILRVKSFLVKDDPNKVLETLESCMIWAQEKELDSLAENIVLEKE